MPFDATLRRPVGALGSKETGNERVDVAKVQTLLAAARCVPVGSGPASASADLVAAIKDFQAAAGMAQSGRVTSKDATMRKLAALLEGPKPRPIELKKITQGGYRIGLASDIVPKTRYQTYLSFRNRSFAVGENLNDAGELPFLVEVTGRPYADLIGAGQLENLLARLGEIDGTGAWGHDAHCVVYVARDGVIVSRSTGSIPLHCPVKPYPGPIGDGTVPEVLDVTLADADGPWTYTENTTPMSSGSLLHNQPLNQRYFFKFGGLFTIKNKLRGFDCTTFPGSIFGLPSTSMGSYDAICSGMRARPVGLEKVKLTAFLKFMEDHTVGTYLVFIGGHHIVVISDAVCHEFNIGPDGRRPYVWDPFMRRKWSTTDTYTVRQVGAYVGDAPNRPQGVTSSVA